ncbi:MYXO-CTERM sorting domain-containing protein [Geodermatophilus sp. SYSU D01119]
MTPEDDRRLEVTADLRLEVDGVPVRVEASGSEISVTSDDVRRLFAAVRVAGGAATQGSPGRTELARVADTLADHGLTARLDGPAGRVLSLGADVDSAAGSAFLGTRRARLHPAGAVRSSGPVPAAVAGLLVVLAVLVRRRRR